MNYKHRTSYYFMKKIFSLFLSTLFAATVLAQTKPDSIQGKITLQQSIDFALRNQPVLKQASIDQEINEKDIRIGLSAWLPQLNGVGSAQHYFKGGPLAGAANIPGGASADISNLSTLSLQASQVIYNNDVNLASRTARYSRQYYQQNTQSAQIDVVSDVSKAFFDVLLSQKQLNITNEDILRLQRSLKDAKSRYDAGVSDKIDFKQATIALNNSVAARKQTTEAIKAKTAYLKQIMGLGPDNNIELAYDSTRYETEAFIDTNQTLDVNNRIEYRLLQTTKALRGINVSYYKWGFLPSLSAVGQYNLIYANKNLSDLYTNTFPNGYVGLSLNIPIFTGTRRLQNLSKARLQEDRTDLDLINSKNTINTEYTQSLASYKTSYTSWQLVKQNVDLAKDVYNVVSLQYREGIKTYLDVIVAQSDLRTAQLNYYNALFQLLSSKIDLQRSLGTLTAQ